MTTNIFELDKQVQEHYRRRNTPFPVDKVIQQELGIPEGEKKCIELKGYRLDDFGYPTYKKRRIIQLLALPDAPKELPYACHKCNNKRCINPEHLYRGSRRDNWMDLLEDQGVRGTRFWCKSTPFDFVALQEYKDKLAKKGNTIVRSRNRKKALEN